MTTATNTNNNANTANNMTPEQVSALTPEQVSALTPEQVSALTATLETALKTADKALKTADKALQTAQTERDSALLKLRSAKDKAKATETMLQSLDNMDKAQTDRDTAQTALEVAQTALDSFRQQTEDIQDLNTLLRLYATHTGKGGAGYANIATATQLACVMKNPTAYTGKGAKERLLQASIDMLRRLFPEDTPEALAGAGTFGDTDTARGALTLANYLSELAPADVEEFRKELQRL